MSFPRINLAIGYAAEPACPQRPADVARGPVPGVAVDDERLYLFTRSEDPVQVYRLDGSFLHSWGRGLFAGPHAATIGPDGALWLTDHLRHVVEKFTPSGELLLRIGTENEPGCDATHMNQPMDVALSADGHIFVADGYVNSRIARFDPNGAFEMEWGSRGVEPGQFSLPHSIAVDSTGRVYVGDRNNVRVQVFDAAGTFVDEWRNLITPWAMCVDHCDELWVAGTTPTRWEDGQTQIGVPARDQLFLRFGRDGRIRQLWAPPFGNGQANQQLGRCCGVHSIAEDAHGNLYVGELSGSGAQKFIRLPEDSPGGRSRPAPDECVAIDAPLHELNQSR